MTRLCSRHALFPEQSYQILVVNLVLTTKQPVSSPNTGGLYWHRGCGATQSPTTEGSKQASSCCETQQQPSLILEGVTDSPEESWPCPTRKSLLQPLVGQRSGMYPGALGHGKMLL